MMRTLTLIVLGVLVAGSAFAARDLSRTGAGIYGTPDPGQTTVDRVTADVLIASSTNGGDFTNMALVWEPVLQGMGLTTTAIEDAAASPFTFPTPFTAAEYPTLLVLGNDNWFSNPEENISLTDEANIEAYLLTGGTMLFIAQDYLYARGNASGFPQIYLGVAAYTDDINADDTDVAYTGVAGGPLDGLSGNLHAETGGVPCFESNPFFTDDIVPLMLGLADYTSMPSNVSGQVGSTVDLGPVKVVFGTIDFGCTSDATQFARDAGALYDYVAGGAVPVEDASWGAVKNMYR
ncbi:MAG: hypothetical protein PVF43_11385 [Candidatus Eiseniibacteriota bacterium]|jgi:hypothetical protein